MLLLMAMLSAFCFCCCLPPSLPRLLLPQVLFLVFFSGAPFAVPEIERAPVLQRVLDRITRIATPEMPETAQKSTRKSHRGQFALARSSAVVQACSGIKFESVQDHNSPSGSHFTHSVRQSLAKGNLAPHTDGYAICIRACSCPHPGSDLPSIAGNRRVHSCWCCASATKAPRSLAPAPGRGAGPRAEAEPPKPKKGFRPEHRNCS